MTNGTEVFMRSSIVLCPSSGVVWCGVAWCGAAARRAAVQDLERCRGHVLPLNTQYQYFIVNNHLFMIIDLNFYSSQSINVITFSRWALVFTAVTV